MEVSAKAASRLRDMIAEDLPKAYGLSRLAQWPHRFDDWDIMLRLGRGIVAERNGEVVGTVMAWRYGADAASLGMVIVSPSCRGQGLGRKLMEAMLTRLGDRMVLLNATDEAVRLYGNLGFHAVGAIHQHQGAAFSVPVVSLRKHERLRPLSSADREAILTLDHAATGLVRKDLIASLIQTAQGVVLDRAGEAVGFALFRRFGHGYAIGPVTAPDVQGAKALISHWLSSRPGMFVRIDVPGDSKVAAWLAGFGLPLVGHVTSMTRHALHHECSSATRFAIVGQAFG